MIRWLNVAGVLAAVVLAMAAVMLRPAAVPGASRVSRLPRVASDLTVLELPNGQRRLVDGGGQAIALTHYERIVSGSTIADALLLEFVSPNRIAAFTNYSARNEVFGYRYEGKPQIDALADMERLLTLEPDLLIVSTLSSASRVQRLREAGLNVFSLGEMRGVDSFLWSVRALATLVGRPELGEVYAEQFIERLRRVAAHLPAESRKKAAQITYYGNKLYGSGRGTSYHDVMTYAGLIDVGAQRFEGWPALAIEQVLEMDPEVVITRVGMGSQLCSQEALAALRACDAERGAIVELPEAWINDPGPMMLPSAEWIHRAVYGTR